MEYSALFIHPLYSVVNVTSSIRKSCYNNLYYIVLHVNLTNEGLGESTAPFEIEINGYNISKSNDGEVVNHTIRLAPHFDPNDYIITDITLESNTDFIGEKVNMIYWVNSKVSNKTLNVSLDIDASKLSFDCSDSRVEMVVILGFTSLVAIGMAATLIYICRKINEDKLNRV